MNIERISAYQIFDSRGMPTLEAEVLLDDGARAEAWCRRAHRPGSSKQSNSATATPTRWRGKSVLRAIENVYREIAPAIVGRDPRDQAGIDRRLIELDGTANKSRLGANAILAVSMAVADAAAKAIGVPLFEYLGDGNGVLLPLPEIQMIGGGAACELAHRRARLSARRHRRPQLRRSARNQSQRLSCRRRPAETARHVSSAWLTRGAIGPNSLRTKPRSNCSCGRSRLPATRPAGRQPWHSTWPPAASTTQRTAATTCGWKTAR